MATVQVNIEAGTQPFCFATHTSTKACYLLVVDNCVAKKNGWVLAEEKELETETPNGR